MIALFDSGIGGLTVLRSLVRRMPERDYLYMCDQAHFPYGGRPREDVRNDVSAFAAMAKREGAEALVLACNTATAIGLEAARQAFGPHAFGVVAPAATRAAAKTRSGCVGVLATRNTCETHAYRDAMNTRACEVPCPELIDLCEHGGASDEEVVRASEGPLAELRRAGSDIIVLGCTHLPVYEDILKTLTTPWAELLDPAETLADELCAQLDARAESGHVECRTTGDADMFMHRLQEELPQVAQRARVSHIPVFGTENR